MPTSLGEVFRLVEQIYRRSRIACEDAMEAVEGRTHRIWSLESSRYLDYDDHDDEWGDEAYNLVPWGCLRYRDSDQVGREIVFVLRYFSRVSDAEPCIVVATTVDPCSEKESSEYNFEFLQRTADGVRAEAVENFDQLQLLTFEDDETHPAFYCFAVSMDRLTDTKAIQERIVEPLVALLEGRIEDALLRLDLDDPARVVLMTPERYE